MAGGTLRRGLASEAGAASAMVDYWRWLPPPRRLLGSLDPDLDLNLDLSPTNKEGPRSREGKGREVGKEDWRRRSGRGRQQRSLVALSVGGLAVGWGMGQFHYGPGSRPIVLLTSLASFHLFSTKKIIIITYLS